MNVFIESTLNGAASGHMEVHTNPSETVDSLISTYCVEKGIRFKRQYVLKNVQNVVLDSAKTIAESGIATGDILYLTTINVEQKLFGFNNWWILFGVSFFIGCIGLITISVLFAKNNKHPPSYGIVFDAGSTHTAMILYLWNSPKNNDTGLVSQVVSCNVEGEGISHYLKNPEKAGESLRDCLKTAEEKIPDYDRKNSLVFLGATAGMRLLNKSNPDIANAIMSSINKTLSSSGFHFLPNQSRIITGQEEGLFGWITVNYLSDKLRDENIESVGAMDLGGASTQITFVPEKKMNSSHIVPLKLYGIEYDVFSQSFLCFGQTEFERRFFMTLYLERKNDSEVDNPCGLKGDDQGVNLQELFNQTCTLPWNNSLIPLNTNVTFKGIGDSEKCNSTIGQLLNVTKCKEMEFSECFDPSPIPPTKRNFVGFSAYFFLMNYFNMTKNPSLNKFHYEINDFCNQSWTQIIKPSIFVRNYCLVGHYVFRILTEKYKFNSEDSWKNLQFVDKIKNIDVGWSLGFMTNATNAIPSEAPLETLNLTTFVILLVIFIVFLLSAIAIAYKAFSQKRNVTSYQRLSQYGAI